MKTESQTEPNVRQRFTVCEDGTVKPRMATRLRPRKRWHTTSLDGTKFWRNVTDQPVRWNGKKALTSASSQERVDRQKQLSFTCLEP